MHFDVGIDSETESHPTIMSRLQTSMILCTLFRSVVHDLVPNERRKFRSKVKGVLVTSD